jgi:uncharacterized protein YcbX
LAPARVAALNVYPVKGACGIPLTLARVETTGFAHAGIGDREWMVVDPDGRFVTQRELPRLALIATAIDDDALVLRTAQRPPLRVAIRDGRRSAREVVVWRSHVRGCDEGDQAARWLSAHLARDVRLVRFHRSKKRACNPDYVGDSGAHTLFADGYPVLVIGSASLDDLNARLLRKGEPALPMNRFRPNLVVEGLDAYDEDHLDTMTIGDVALRMVKPCTRCQVTTTDQATAKVGIEPLPTLAGYRQHARLDGVAFGMNAIVVRSGEVRVNADVAVTYRF